MSAPASSLSEPSGDAPRGMSRAHAVSPFSGEFSDPALEREYLSASWERRSSQIATTCLIGAAAFLATIGIDLTDQAGSPWLAVAVLMRVITALTLIGLSLWFRRLSSYRPRADVALLAVSFVVAAAFVAATYPLRDRLMYVLLSALVLTVANYVFLPNRLRYSAAAGVCMAALMFVFHVRLSAAPAGEKSLSVLLLLCTNLLGVQFIRVIGRSLREVYATSRALEHAIAQRSRAEEAAAVDRAKTQFYMNINHGLRTPINGIIGYIELIEEDIAEGDLDTLRSDLQRVRVSSLRLQRTLGSILELSRLESDRVPVRPTRVSIDALARELIEPLRERARARGNTLEYTSAQLEFTSDAALVQRCLATLLDNAIQFTEQGVITLSATRGSSGAIQLRVRDTGVGIPEHVQSSIFDAFTRADESTIGTAPRTGLSLAVTHKICELLGGRVTVESSPERGSCFTLELPDMSE